MKKSLILSALLAVGAMAGAQTTYQFVYIPGVGEHQFGLSVAPTFGVQQLSVSTRNFNSYDEDSYPVEGVATNSLGINAGFFYGYETVHGGTLEQGNHTTLLYSLNPFGGDVTLNHNGTPETHNFKYNSQRLLIHSTSFLTYRISEEISVSGGIGLGFGLSLPSQLKVDGEAIERQKSSDIWGSSLFGSLLNMEFTFDVNVGMKYWLTDEFFLGARLQYCFYTLNLAKVSDNGNKSKWDYNGAIAFDPDNHTAICNYYYPKSLLQLVLSAGYTW